MHELATNALKCGALTHDGGAVEIAWSWENKGCGYAGAKPVALLLEPPSREGLGPCVIRAGIQGLRGTLRMDWTVQGVSCEIVLPATHVISEN